MRRHRLLAVLMIVLLLSGCNSFGFGSDGEASTDTRTETEIAVTNTATTTPESTPTPAPAFTKDGSDTRAGDFDQSFNSDRVVLALSELPTGYSFQGETRNHLKTASGTTLEAMQEDEQLLVHNRAYETQNQSLPELVFSSVAVYKSSESARSWLETHLSELREQYDASIDRQLFVNGLNATVVQFENNQNRRTIAIYARQSNLVYYVAVSDTTYNHNIASRLFIRMASDLES